jgi:hypothetical protein
MPLRASLLSLLLAATLVPHVAARGATPEVTNESLLAVLFPEMRSGDEPDATAFGATALPVRRIDSDDAPATLEVSAVDYCSSLRIPDGAATRYLLVAKVRGEEINDDEVFPGEAMLVAVFDAGPRPRLLDVVDVQEDRESDVAWGEPTSNIGPRARAIVAVSSHHNSSQNYESQTMLYVHDGRLKVAASLSLLSWRSCEEEVTEEASFRVRPRRGSPFGDVVATVEVTRRQARDCDLAGSRASVRRYRELYSWRGPKAGYVDAGGTIGEVDKLNEANY